MITEAKHPAPAKSRFRGIILRHIRLFGNFPRAAGCGLLLFVVPLQAGLGFLTIRSITFSKNTATAGDPAPSSRTPGLDLPLAVAKAMNDHDQVGAAKPKAPPAPSPSPFAPKPETKAAPAPSAAAPPKTRMLTDDRADLIGAGATIYRANCRSCHGKDGKGKDLKDADANIPDFTSRAWLSSRSDPQLSVSILDGKGHLMPAFRERFTAAQVKALVAYIRAFGPARADPPEPPAPANSDQKIHRLLEEFEALKRQQEELRKDAKTP